MSGFVDGKLNSIFQRDAIEQISDYLLIACQNVKDDYCLLHKKLPNDENQIRSILVNEYIAVDENQEKYDMKDFRFDIESPEHYLGDGIHLGRADIKVILLSDFDKNSAYYLVECKRIDGTKKLNRFYVEEGVKRFVTRKYSSFYGKNIMLAFVVKELDIHQNVIKIEEIQNGAMDFMLHDDLELLAYQKGNKGIYKCSEGDLELRHLFFSFCDIMDKVNDVV